MTFTTYRDTLDYLYAQLPMFTRVGASAYKEDLTNTLALCQRLGNPERKFRSIHIGGTNGKGSTSHMLAAILQTAGYKTGLHTSPHLKDFRERIRINGQMITEQAVVDFVNLYQDLFESLKPSFFEATVAMAFDCFAKEQVDIAIIEVGLGGRLDSTNVISPLLAIITNIGLDHMNILGNSLPEIALEKAGIIKPGIPAIIGESHPETKIVFEQKAQETKSPISFASGDWEIMTLGKREYLKLKASNLKNGEALELELDLTGSYQLKNLPAVLSAVAELRKQGFNISNEHIQAALKQVKNLTGLMGRWQTLRTHPLVICDTGHNEDGIKEVLKNIAATPHENLHFVLGMVKDKDITKILSLLPKEAHYYFCQPDIPRAKPVRELTNEAAALGLSGESHSSVKQAYETALNKATSNDLIFIGGSTFVVAEVV
ncbi:MAG: bifunctional folylpolyglutamate synthase/dihydrofolate synthase [Sphingobacteriaceae bacterium]